MAVGCEKESFRLSPLESEFLCGYFVSIEMTY